jgi:glycosyltransferase involved in cell wall biosynthesis
MPSPYESLSIVLLEAWMHQRPVLVNGRCEVLKGQCRRSNAGLWFDNYDEFEICMNLIVTNEPLANALGKNGYIFTEKNYNWDIIKQKYISLISAFMQR